MLAVLELSVQIVLGIAVPIWIIRRDIDRLGAPLLGRCWNDASLLSAAVGFGPLAVIVHFIRSRRSFLGVLLGLTWASVVTGLTYALSVAFELLG